MSAATRKVTAIPRMVTARVSTDDLSRHPESQIRAEPDPSLIAEYAEAMIEGAEFPPVVIYQDQDGTKYLADGHHRVDAAALAALKDSRRRAEVLAEIRPGTLQDALRHALQANTLHGKRLSQADYRRAIRMAFDNGLVTVERAADIVPALVTLTGCSVRTAQENSIAERRAMISKRDRMIWAMHREGRSQEAIGAELDVDHSTVSRVIDRVQNRDAAETHKALRPKPPKAWPEQETPAEPIAAEAPPVEDAPRYRVDVGPYLPLLARLAPLAVDDEDSGTVGVLPDVPDTEDDGEDDPRAVKALETIDRTLTTALDRLDNLAGLRQPFRPKAAEAALAKIERAQDFLDELRAHIEGESA
jgi:ParB-like chromosome segregation protein Spo0J